MSSNTHEFLDLLERGELRAAYQDSVGLWHVNVEVKKSILNAFKEGHLEYFANYPGAVDKHNLSPQTFNIERSIRLVPGGSSVRRGSFIASKVVIMPPSYINIGAYVDEATMVDSHVLVGSCAQIGKRVHLSAGVQIGGVLEPIGLRPVIIEDDAFIGAGAIIVEGIHVKRRAIIAPSVTLSRSIPIFDVVHNRQLEREEAIPEGAVVVSGTRAFSTQYTYAREMGLNLNCAIIIKYRDEKTDTSVVLENCLR